MGRTACTEPQCLYSTAIRLLPIRAVQPVQSLCLYSRAIPLLPLWAVRPVRTLSACTVELYLYSPYGPYGLYRTSVPVQCSYTSTPHKGRTACTEPQYLYSTAIPLLPSVPVQYSYTSTPLSACTVQLYLYSPYGPCSLYRASVPVEGSTLPLHHLSLRYLAQCMSRDTALAHGIVGD